MRKHLIAASLALLATLPAFAGEHVYDITGKTYQSECASCHIAYPPQLLPAESWRKLMAGLAKHFGTDASVDARVATELTRFLEQNAGGRRNAADPAAAAAPPRISTTPWFIREHRKIATSQWQSKTIGSAANCSACHSRADNGDYSERSLRIPR